MWQNIERLENTMANDFSKKCDVLADFYIDGQYLGRIPNDIIEYMEQEAPYFELAWCISQGHAKATPSGIEAIEETFQGLLSFENIREYVHG